MIKCQCGEPMRFVKSIVTLINGLPNQVTGLECPDKNCRKTKVVPNDVWVASLVELPFDTNPWGGFA